MGRKDEWNATHPTETRTTRSTSRSPSSPKLLPVLYPGVFPNLGAYRKDRADLLAILLTGIPAGSSPASRTSPARRKPTCCG